MKNRRTAVVLAVLLFAAGCSGDNVPAADPGETDAPVDAANEARRVRFQDVWIYEQISTVDLSGEEVDLTSAILGTAADLGEPVTLSGETTFLVWPALDPYLLDGDGSTRHDVDVVAGIVRDGDHEAVMVVGTPAAASTPPIDEDDEVRIDLTAIEDQLQPGDPLVMRYTFAHTFGPDADDAPSTGVELFLHRAERKRLRFAAGPDGGVALLTDLGQAYAGSVEAGTPAKAQPMLDGYRDGVGNCLGDVGVDCIGDYFEDFGDGSEVSYVDLMGQVCAGDDCDDGDDDDGDGDNGDGDGDNGGDGGGDGGGGGDDRQVEVPQPDTADKKSRCFHNCKRPDPEPGDAEYCRVNPGAQGCGNENDPDARKPPQPNAGSTEGDPHIHTFDGRHYVIQSVGEFVLAETGDWMTQVRYVSRDDRRRYSLANMVVTRIDGRTVVFDPSPEDENGNELDPKVTLDGDPVELVRNGSVVEIDGLAFGHRVGYLWVEVAGLGSVGVGTLGYPRVDVVVFDSDLESHGLLGDRDGNPDNDFRLGPDGEEFLPSQDEIHTVFADAWRVTDETSLFPYGPGESTADYTDLDHPGEPIASAVEASGREAQAETLCRIARVSNAGMHACIIDYSVTGDVSWVTGSAISDRFRGFVRGEAEVGGSSGTDDTVAHGSMALEGLTPIGGTPPGYSDGVRFYQFVRDPGIDRDVLVAVDVASGTERWRVEGVQWQCGVGVLGDGRIAVVRVGDDGTDEASSFTVLDAETGDAVMSTEWLDAPSVYCLPMVAVDDRVVVAGALGDVVGWSLDGEPALEWQTKSAQIAAIAATDDDRVLIQRRQEPERLTSALELVAPVDGAVLDRAEVPGRDPGSLLTVGDRVVTVGGATGEEGQLAVVVGLAIADDSLVRQWERPYLDADAGAGPEETALGVPRHFATDGDLLVGLAGAEVLALDLVTGEERWRADPEGFRNSSAPLVVAAGVVYDNVFGGAALVALSADDGSLIVEHSNDDVFGTGSGAGHRGIYGPVVGDRLVVEGTGPGGDIVIAFVPLT